MRVAYVANAPFISGAERSLQITLGHIRDADVDPVVICPGDSPLRAWCEAESIPVEPCALPVRDKRHLIQWLRGRRRMQRILERQRIDLVPSNQLWSYPICGAAGRRLGIRRICHIRDESSQPALEWYLASGTDGVVSISEHIGRQVAERWPDALKKPRIWTLLNPVRVDASPSDAAHRSEARAALGISDTAVVFGFIGQIAPVKGVLPLIEALAGMHSPVAWQFLIAGRDPHGGDYYRACVDRATALGLEDRVRFLGFLDDPTVFYRDFVALRHTLELVLADRSQAARLGAAARARAARQFDPATYVKRLRSIYDELLNQPEKSR